MPSTPPENASFQIAIREGIPEDHLTIDHNLIDGYKGFEGEIYGENAIIGEAMFIRVFDRNSPMEADFHLQPNSPAIDKGLSEEAPVNDYDGNSRPKESGCDIGAFEAH